MPLLGRNLAEHAPLFALGPPFVLGDKVWRLAPALTDPLAAIADYDV